MIIAVVAFCWAVVVSAVALWLPPAGVIDSSVLVLIAQILILVGTFCGIDVPIVFNRNAHQG